MDTPSHKPRPLQVPPDLERQVAAALEEDIRTGDVTAALVPEGELARGEAVTREDATLCGTPWVEEIFRRLDPRIRLAFHARDGDAIHARQAVFHIEGPARAVLTGERAALNFLQLLSGTATAARRCVDAVAGTGATILDTRKTLPGLRTAQKYAVRCGGAHNHRMGLHDMILIKENHIAAAGSLTAAIGAARRIGGSLPVEVEVESAEELEEALAARPDIIMLDDFTLAALRAAVVRVRESGVPVKLEASGSVTLQTVRAIAETGVDLISVGGLTKHVQAVDLSLRLSFRPQGA
ncbi:MAG: carboxylating nicotinate-nucleotide diphosphorylase [Steroidobacteraceae bacterium]